MTNPPTSEPLPHQRALAHCDGYIGWYEKSKVTARRLDYLLQAAAISLSAVTPLMLLIESLAPVFKALPATLAAIAVGSQGVFKFRERYLGFAMAGELLKAERFRLEIGIANLTPGESRYVETVAAFADRVNEIVLRETSEWRQNLSDVAAASNTVNRDG